MIGENIRYAIKIDSIKSIVLVVLSVIMIIYLFNFSTFAKRVSSYHYYASFFSMLFFSSTICLRLKMLTIFLKESKIMDKENILKKTLDKICIYDMVSTIIFKIAILFLIGVCILKLFNL